MLSWWSDGRNIVLHIILHPNRTFSDFALECEQAGVLLEIMTDEYTFGKWARATVAGLRVVPPAQRGTGWYSKQGVREGDSIPHPLLFMIPKMEHNQAAQNIHRGVPPENNVDAWRNMVHQRFANVHFMEYVRWDPKDLQRPLRSVLVKAVGDSLLWSHVASLSARTYNPMDPTTPGVEKMKRLDRLHLPERHPRKETLTPMELAEPFEARIVNAAHLR